MAKAKWRPVLTRPDVYAQADKALGKPKNLLKYGKVPKDLQETRGVLLRTLKREIDPTFGLMFHEAPSVVESLQEDLEQINEEIRQARKPVVVGKGRRVKVLLGATMEQEENGAIVIKASNIRSQIHYLPNGEIQLRWPGNMRTQKERLLLRWYAGIQVTPDGAYLLDPDGSPISVWDLPSTLRIRWDPEKDLGLGDWDEDARDWGSAYVPERKSGLNITALAQRRKLFK